MGNGGLSAIILAAGAGSRLRDAAPVKPLAEVAGRPLLLHALDSLAAAGVACATVVTGHAAEAVDAVLGASPIPAASCRNPNWASAPNGVSLLAAREAIRGPTLLMMADHLVSPRLVQRLVAAAPAPAGLALAVDRRLGNPLVDEADVTRVRTQGSRILAIGKVLACCDAYDTGVFMVTDRLALALDGLPAPSLSEGVAVLAREGQAEAVDIGDAFWIDVDDPIALAQAERHWQGRA